MRDSLWGRLCIGLFSQRIAQAIQVRVSEPGYAGFVATAQKIMAGRAPSQQQAVVLRVLRSLVPAPVTWCARKFLRPKRWVCESNAWFATRLTRWLVGPSWVETVTLADGSRWRSGVHIEKCRYLEASRCVGLCINLCQQPTQIFFSQDFGIPLTMTPNFDDLSCKMIFGEPAPEITPVHPCLAECPTAASRYACPKKGT